MVPEAILCVDDEGIILIHLQLLLERRYGPRFRYACASNAADGIAKIRDLDSEGVKVAVIISDWFMPGDKGDVFLRKVHAEWPETRAIMVSGKVDADGLGDLFEMSILVGFLPKPVDAKRLYELVDGVIGPAGTEN